MARANTVRSAPKATSTLKSVNDSIAPFETFGLAIVKDKWAQVGHALQHAAKSQGVKVIVCCAADTVRIVLRGYQRALPHAHA
jgi:hypothetical protein